MLSNCSRFVPRVITRISISRTKVNWQINNILFDLVVNSSVAYILNKSIRNLTPFESRICRPKIVEIPSLPIDISYIIVLERITIFRSVYQLYICQRESKIRSRQMRTCFLDNQIDWIWECHSRSRFFSYLFDRYNIPIFIWFLLETIFMS